MITFQVKLADIPIEISANFRYSKQILEEYLTKETPEVVISVSASDICFEEKLSSMEDQKAGRPAGCFSDEYLESLAVYRKLADALVYKNVLVVHGSALCLDGKGYLFSAPSGTGKSTHAALWKRLYGERVLVLNDDKPMIRLFGNKAYLYGTPWDGKHHISINEKAPLLGIAMLKQADINRMTRLSPSESYPQFLQHIHRPLDREGSLEVMRLLGRLSDNVPMYQLECNMDIQAAMVSSKILQEGNDGN